MNSVIQNYIDCAVRGADHSAVPEQGSDACGALLGSIAFRSPAHQILLSAGTEWLYNLAGTLLPEMDSSSIAPVESEVKPYCSRSAEHLARIILDRSDSALLQEFLTVCISKEKAISPELLHDVVSATIRVSPDLLKSAAGKRGEWIAKLVPEYAPLLLVPEKQSGNFEQRLDQWQLVSNPDQRCELLREVRAEDPAEARRWVEQVWKEEKADIRIRFTELLAENITVDDLPFLEKISSDKSKIVTKTAFNAALEIPGSFAETRAEERIRAFVRISVTSKGTAGKLLALFSGGSGENRTFESLIPDSYEKSWSNDGILETGYYSSMGPKSIWLTQMVSQVRPEFWENHFGLPAEKLFEAALNSELDLPLFRGWCDAAVRFKNEQWITALYDFFSKISDLKQKKLSELKNAIPTGSLFANLQLEVQHQKVMEKLPLKNAEFDYQEIRYLDERSSVPESMQNDLISYFRKVTVSSDISIFKARFSHWSILQRIGYLRSPEQLAESLLPEPNIANPGLDWHYHSSIEKVKQYNELISLRMQIYKEFQ